MKKRAVIFVFVVLIVLFSLMVNGLNYETQFNDSSSSKLLDFSQNRDQNAYVNLVSHAYVVSTSLSLTGLLSDWETVKTYNSSTSPVSSQYISDTKWLVTDDAAGATNDVVLYNPTTQNIVASYDTSSSISDADYVNDEIWLVADRTIDAALLINSTDDSIISNFSGLSNPEAVDYITNELWLIGDTGNNRVLLVNVTSQTIIKNLSGLGSVKDVQAVSTEKWLIVDAGNTKTFLYNSTSGTNTSYNGLLIPSSVDYVSDEIWLVSLNTVNKKVSLLNVTSSTEIAVYQDASLSEPRDARYISANNWLITDKSGTREVHEMKKYYPNDLNFTISSVGINYWAGKFNSSVVETGFTSAMNDYLTGCSGANCDIPLSFHSDTSGKLNLSLLNVSFNRKPSVNITAPQAGNGWTNTESFNWTMSDDDGDTMTAKTYFWNGFWNLVNTSVGAPGDYNLNFDTTPYADGSNYQFKTVVNDSYNNASDETGNFTIDNTNPLIWNLRTNDSDNIVRSDSGLLFSVEASDLFLQNVQVNGSAMTQGAGTIWSVANNAGNLGCSSGANNSCLLTATARDIVNRQNSTNLAIVIDDVNPSIENLTSNALNDTADKDDWVNFTVEVSDANLDTVVLEDRSMTNGGALWYLNIQPTTLGCSANSVCILNATATDKANNTNLTTYNLTISAEPFTPSSGGGGGSSKRECNDGKDNDGDGLIDMDDPGCERSNDNDEYNDPTGGSCVEEWNCGEWEECLDGKQTRTCVEDNNCGTEFFKPGLEQECVVPPVFEAAAAGEEEPPVEITPAEPPVGVGRSISLFDRLKANWWAVALGMAAIAGLAAVGWKKNWLRRKKGGPRTGFQS